MICVKVCVMTDGLAYIWALRRTCNRVFLIKLPIFCFILLKSALSTAPFGDVSKLELPI